jgi:hypothetical protein
VPENAVYLRLANCHSLVARILECREELDKSDNCIYAFCETWLRPEIDDDEFNPRAKYSVYRSDRTDRNHHGGTLIMIPNRFPSYQIGNSESNHSFEAISVGIKIGSNSLIIILVYRPPGRDPNFIDRWENYFDSLNISNQSYIVLGDLNFPEIDWQRNICPGNQAPSKFLTFANLNGLSQEVTEPTLGNNILDIVLTSEVGIIKEISVIPPFYGSDHDQVSCKLGFSAKKSQMDPGYRNFIKADYKSIRNSLQSVSWPDLFANCRNVDEMYHCYLQILTRQIINYVPLCNKKFGKQWSKTIKKLKSEQKRLHRKVKINRKEADRFAYKKLSQKIRIKIKQEIRSNEEKIIRNGKDNTFWSFVNSKTKCKPELPAIKDGNILITDDTERAEAFNNYFASTFTLDDGNPPVNPKLPADEQSELSECFFPPEKVFTALMDLPRKTSYGPDGIPSIFLKELAFQLAYPLSLIFNVSFQSSKIPEIWKMAIVTPIHKKGPKSKVDNYRPISLTCISCKVMESVICEEVVKFLDSRNIIASEQHGFLSKKSTVTQMLHCMNEWTKLIDKNQLIDALYLDLAKAFDSVSHSKLLTLLSKLGIKGNLHNWIRAFLSDRIQKTRVNRSFSQTKPVTSGIPQGSVAGPLLFLIFINDLPNVLKHSKVYMFADDCKIYFSFNRNENSDCLQQDLSLLFDWIRKMQLSLAVEKCAVMHFSSNNPQKVYNIENRALETVDEIRDLGFIISKDLQFSKHCQTIVKLAAQRMNCILRTFQTRNTSFLIKCFNTFVRSKLEYGSQIWSPYHLDDIDLIESVQREFTRRIPAIKKYIKKQKLKKKYFTFVALERI